MDLLKAIYQKVESLEKGNKAIHQENRLLRKVNEELVRQVCAIRQDIRSLKREDRNVEKYELLPGFPLKTPDNFEELEENCKAKSAVAGELVIKMQNILLK